MQDALIRFEQQLNSSQKKTWERLTNPFKIQEFLDRLPYSAEKRYRSPLSVLKQREAHCFDGALFAAAALRRLGYPPLLIYTTSVHDDDHLLAPFKQDGFWGAVGKSNYMGLRFREPIHRNIRELIISYFESYFNIDAEKTMRGYTRTIHLAKFDRVHWMSEDQSADLISDHLDEMKVIPVLTKKMIRNLSPVDKRTYRAQLMGANRAGLYDPSKDE